MLQRFIFTIFFLLLAGVSAQTLPLCDKALEQGFYSNSEGWLYHSIDRLEEFALEKNPEILPYLSALGQAFADNDITVVTALLPTRAMVYSQGLEAVDYNQQRAWESYQRFRNLLNAEGFLTPDLLYRFRTAAQEGNRVFFKLDHHWTPEGSRLTAEEIANTIKTLGSYQNLEQQVYTTRVVGDETYRGSRIVDVEALCGAIDIADEPFNRFETVASAGTTGGLFGDVAGPVVAYVGTSNGEDTMNFPGNLRELLGVNVLKANMIGGATFTAMQNFLYSNDYQQDGYRPTYLVWELNVNTTTLTGDDILEFSQPLSYRQLIPSLYRQCGSEALVEANSPGKVIVDAANLSLSGSRYYLSVFSENPAVTALQLRVNYQNGETENLTLRRPSRLTSPNRFFLEFSDFYQSAITSVEVSAPEDASASLQAQVCDTGREIPRKYAFVSADLTRRSGSSGMTLSGFDQPEADTQQSWRWGLGDSSSLRFMAPSDQALDLYLEVTSPLENQEMDVVFNGEVLDTQQIANGLAKTYRLNPVVGANVIEFRYADWNGNQSTVSSTDSRPLAVVFNDLRLEPASAIAAVTQPSLSETTVPETTVSETTISETTVQTAQPATEPGTKVLTMPLAIDLAKSSAESYKLIGVSEVEADRGRWLLGPSTTISFELPQSQAVRANLAFSNPIHNQTVEILFNGELVETLSELQAQGYYEKDYRLSARSGTNLLEFRYADWNQNRTVFSQNDPRPMAVFLSRLEFLADKDAQTITETAEVQTNVTEDLLPTGDLITSLKPQGVTLEGISELENGDYRWALGPETKINFASDSAQALEVEMALFNPIEGQSVTVTFNGAVVQDLGRLHQGTEMNIKFYVNVIPGENSLVIRYSDWNGAKTTFASKDSRPLAVLFKVLEIRNRSQEGS